MPFPTSHSTISTASLSPDATPTTSSVPKMRRHQTPAIIGAIVAIVLGLAILSILVLFYIRKRRKRQEQRDIPPDGVTLHMYQFGALEERHAQRPLVTVVPNSNEAAPMLESDGSEGDESPHSPTSTLWE